jgi:hypothetical protein
MFFQFFQLVVHDTHTLIEAAYGGFYNTVLLGVGLAMVFE